MNDLQIFENHEFGQVRTVELDGRIDQLKIVCCTVADVSDDRGVPLPHFHVEGS